MKVGAALYGLFLVVAIGVWVVVGYTNDKELDAVIDRAQVAAKAEDMLDYLNMYKSNLQKRGLTTGHTALIFKNPRNDLSLHYKAVNNMIERLEMVQEMNATSVEYQTALDDLRDTTRELEFIAEGVTWVKTMHWFLWVAVGGGIVLFLRS